MIIANGINDLDASGVEMLRHLTLHLAAERNHAGAVPTSSRRSAMSWSEPVSSAVLGPENIYPTAAMAIEIFARRAAPPRQG